MLPAQQSQSRFLHILPIPHVSFSRKREKVPKGDEGLLIWIHPACGEQPATAYTGGALHTSESGIGFTTALCPQFHHLPHAIA